MFCFCRTWVGGGVGSAVFSLPRRPVHRHRASWRQTPVTVVSRGCWTVWLRVTALHRRGVSGVCLCKLGLPSGVREPVAPDVTVARTQEQPPGPRCPSSTCSELCPGLPRRPTRPFGTLVCRRAMPARPLAGLVLSAWRGLLERSAAACRVAGGTALTELTHI